LEAGVATNSVIAIVDDDQSVREGTRDLIEAMGFVAGTFDCAEKFLESKTMDATACLIADVRLPGMTGLELQDRLVRSGKRIPTILITAFSKEKERVRALQASAVCYLTKPINEGELVACIRLAFKGRKTDTTGS
jgi:FixJ family two-component response regulator